MAQLVERMTSNHEVRGSNPRGSIYFFFLFLLPFLPNATVGCLQPILPYYSRQLTLVCLQKLQH
ncbi:hypothetical protein BDV26DRAFT_54068 [Aspergillus bertholletiae]|uniref:Uncharacterized protein n=1 Tax=Aspergillus bertholletiae TaxID=1226010 RepID=A0A5N7AW34_9EURO|nr:hypothetical protein BDV26DRAFT_54068 [Aspergillus bertholletiae]